MRATRGKQTRVEPIAALYEQGRVKHLGLARLRIRWFVTRGGYHGKGSPDRVGALVWALNLMLEQYLRPRGSRAATVMAQKDGRSVGSDAGVLMPIHRRHHLEKKANNKRANSQRMIWTYRIGTFQSKLPKSQPPMVRVSQPFWRWDEGDPYRRCAYVGAFCSAK